jgi:hypothetical protein
MGHYRFAWFVGALALATLMAFGIGASSAGFFTGIIRWAGIISLVLAVMISLYPAFGKPLRSRSGDEANPLPSVVVLAVMGLGLVWLGADHLGHNSAGAASLPSRAAHAIAPKNATGSGRTASASKALPKQVSDEALIVGRWIDPVPYGLGVAIIKQSGKGYVLLAEPTEVKHYQLPLQERDHGGHKRFWVVGADERDWFEIEDDDRLQMGDKHGKSEILEIAPPGAGNGDVRAEALEKAKEEYKCNADIDCVAQNLLFNVPELCDPLVERQARYQYRWTDGLFGGLKYSGHRWNLKRGEERHLVDFYGDRLELQNGFGAWANYVYVCTINIQSNTVTSVRVAPGRL